MRRNGERLPRRVVRDPLVRRFATSASRPQERREVRAAQLRRMGGSGRVEAGRCPCCRCHSTVSVCRGAERCVNKVLAPPYGAASVLASSTVSRPLPERLLAVLSVGAPDLATGSPRLGRRPANSRMSRVQTTGCPGFGRVARPDGERRLVGLILKDLQCFDACLSPNSMAFG